MINRIRRCSSRKEYEQLIDDYITVGYTVKARGEDNAHLIKKGRHTKHGLVFLLTFWCKNMIAYDYNNVNHFC